MPNNCTMYSHLDFLANYFFVLLGLYKDHQIFYKMCHDGGDYPEF